MLDRIVKHVGAMVVQIKVDDVGGRSQGAFQ